MSVSQYKPNECIYRIDKLDDVVYLIPEQALRNINIDNGEAYIENIQYVPLMFHCYNITLEDTDTLDERYEFTHTLKFSVNGYVNHKDFQGRYYVIVRSVDNEYWLVNPLFPCKVTYTYTLGHNESHTDFTLSTISNHPTLRIHDMNQGRPYPCKDYLLNGIDRLFLNEKRYSTHSGNQIYYTNDGFKEVEFDKRSATFTEQFDGTNVSHGIKFNIKFDDYKDSWHYNLLEFTDNLYAAIVTTKKNEYVLCGFGFGLQPSYTVTSDGEMTPDHIEVKLVDMHDNGDLFTLVTSATISPNDEREYKFTLEYDAWECVSDGYAKYLLKKEFDVLGNPTGRYKCLSGYTEQFSFLGDNLIGTFDEIVTFYQPQCKEGECALNTSLMSPIKMNAQQCKLFTIKADSDWTITNNADYLQISPTSGSGGTTYTVELCNNRPQSAASITTSITINYCSTAETYTVKVCKDNGCFYGGDEFEIGPEGQYVTIPIDCCVASALETTSALTNIQVFENYIKVYVPQNNTNSARTFTLDVTLCDDADSEVIITQSNVMTRWWAIPSSGEYICSGSSKYTKEYLQISYDGGSTWEMAVPQQIRAGQLIEEDSVDCEYTIRWIDTEETVCYNGRKYIVQAEQIKYSTSSEWINTGNQRRGDETADSPAECSGTTYEEWRVVEGEYICDGTTKYRKLRLYTSTDNINWVATDTYKKGEVIEYNSTDCGYSPTGETYYEWRIEGTQCNGYDLYNWERKYVSNDGNTWTPTGTYRYGSLIEANSSQCGYVPPIVYEYQWSATTGYVCSGTNKMTREIYQRRISGSSDPWENVVPTQERAAQPMIESASTDCGYTPPVEPMYKWVTISINQDYVCDECPIPTKFYATYNDSTTYSAACDSNTTLTSATTRAHTTPYSAMTSAVVGDCVTALYRSSFIFCSGLTSCTIGSGVTFIEQDAFRGCRSLISINIPSGVRIIGTDAFSGCTSLTSANIPSSVTSMGHYVFNFCTSLESVEIQSGITSISYGTFNMCSGLTSVVIPSSVTNIDGIAFNYCTSLTSVTIPNNVTSIGDSAFRNTPWWNSYSSDTTNHYGNIVYINDVAYEAVSTNITSATFRSGTVSIGGGAFEHCTGLTSINIIDSITIIREHAFALCSSLTSIDIPSGVTSIGSQTFYYCTGLTSVTVNATTPPTLENNAFQNTNCTIYVPSGSVDTYKATSGWSTYASRIQAIPNS